MTKVQFRHFDVITKKIIAFVAVLLILTECKMDDGNNDWIESQVTTGAYGHFLNPVQAWSPDGDWMVYDTRNEDSHIGRTGTIERINLITEEKQIVYQSKGQTIYGPGVGAAAWSPVNNAIIFIHGLNNANEDYPYDITRRSGAVVLLDQVQRALRYDARDIRPPFTVGALRGGTHAHSWSGNGQWISFTYNDAIIADLSSRNSSVEDLRLVGVMAPWGRVKIQDYDRKENFDGRMFAMVVSRVTESPKPGSDEISKAYEDGWIGENGYIDALGIRHKCAIAFLGDLRDGHGNLVTEVFVVDVPEKKPDLTREEQLKGTEITRPEPLAMVVQRRVTHTENRKYPGVQGPRQWMKSSPDGSFLYFMMRDDEGFTQLYSVPTIGGDIEQITANDFSIGTSFDIDPSGKLAAYGVDQKVYITNLESGNTKCVTPDNIGNHSDLRAIQWSPAGVRLAYNRKVVLGDSSYFQIFTLEENER